MISASSLMRHCGHPRALSKVPPRDAAERKREANKKASADIGVEFHRAAEEWILAGEGGPPISDNPEVRGWLDGLATMFAPHGKGVDCEVAWGLTPDGAYCPVDEFEPHVYVPQKLFEGMPLPELLTAGRADAAWEDGGLVWVVDWKTGRYPVTPATRNLQVNAAGMALASKVGASGYIPAIFYTRDSYFDWGEPVTFGTEQHRSILAEVREAALLDETPRPGPACPTCWEKKRCAAYKETP